MQGETNLNTLLQFMQRTLREGEYVFCSVNHKDNNYLNLKLICTFIEDEGLTLILSRHLADTYELSYTFVFRMITLSVHSSLEAVGFLAAITGKLAEHGISVNPVSAYYHDHLFVPLSQADEVIKLLQEFSS
ncbi:ribonuclease H like protein [Calothrix sp. NIES-4071]|nr:ribonuclease H like protein [Calothrix sp. NIES-4071]BAZ63453.1 ribonuclease H like protein [Calothrix sp. NIES-4105]